MSNSLPLEVTLSQAVPFTHTGPYPEVAGAAVFFSEEGSSPEALLEWQTGRFSGGATTSPGRTYTLEIQSPDGRITATATAPAGPLSIDSLTFIRKEDSTASLYCHLRLPQSRPVYGRARVRVDGALHEELFIEKALEQQAALTVSFELSYALPGSIAALELTTLPKPAFEFYTAIRTNTLDNNFNPANSKNPPTNLLGGGAIGFFSAVLTDTASVVVQ